MNDFFVKTAKELLDEGEKFNYDNFCVKSEYGYVSIIDSEYTSWKSMVENFIVEVFTKQSVVYKTFLEAEKFRVIDNGIEIFNNAHNIIIASLKTALKEFQFRDYVKENEEEQLVIQNNKVFVVHGHDESLKNQLVILLGELGLEPIILHRQSDGGSSTIIEKFEKHSDVGYAFVLLTPDEFAYSKSEENLLEKDRKKEYRARQNVIFELGYFFGKLGRTRVTCIYKKGVTVPSDLQGIIYKEVVSDVEEKAREIMRELKEVGYQVKI
ncbi:TIR domain-containing protein [Clostridium estertheticum]|uniref:Nucleotide-binding protein n=1 Tax=Clostridium estertheticum TaxID=238834 RepID=A0AA47EIN8_9CLOT|nr:nucleotide-binding protein [Clostridium estertheticum]MBU3153528.1 nucleotide-binding protein [Clostridium estertheticum]WAG60927.1 nucleotide-binding protein [Clostridium estertheticum]